MVQVGAVLGKAGENISQIRKVGYAFCCNDLFLDCSQLQHVQHVYSSSGN